MGDHSQRRISLQSWSGASLRGREQGFLGGLEAVGLGAGLVGPPLSVTLLSLWELRRLRTHFGLTVRGALRQDDRVPA
ncbi:hypothetical protein ACFVRD_25900 [Streptomyces sp. NPDC057908]|uniref:hypothetical protein n=1 Tax=Streptomyces sp. NPDC057908 TaxID=3346276 RepID=UPI0036E90476